MLVFVIVYVKIVRSFGATFDIRDMELADFIEGRIPEKSAINGTQNLVPLGDGGPAKHSQGRYFGHPVYSGAKNSFVNSWVVKRVAASLAGVSWPRV